jgi:hypothetical protein
MGSLITSNFFYAKLENEALTINLKASNPWSFRLNHHWSLTHCLYVYIHDEIMFYFIKYFILKYKRLQIIY